MVDVKPVQPAEGLSLSRWSRLKRSGGEAVSASSSSVSVTPDAVGTSALSSPAVDAANVSELKLPQLSSISLVEDFTPFMQAKVPQALRQQALKALFKEPHFNVMDGLDTYIDDYTVFEPITPEVMATLSSWKSIMNPTQQVVTPGGYAVDVESDEGKAVLAARAEALEANVLPASSTDEVQVPSPAARERAEGEGGGNGDHFPERADSDEVRPDLDVATDTAHAAALPPTLSRTAGEGVARHHRHNKRVSDFTYVEGPEVSPPVPPTGAEKAE